MINPFFKNKIAYFEMLKELCGKIVLIKIIILRVFLEEKL